MLDLQAVGSPAAGVGQVGEAESVAGERGRPLQLVHGDVYGLAQGSVQDKCTTGQLQRYLQQSRVKLGRMRESLLKGSLAEQRLNPTCTQT